MSPAPGTVGPGSVLQRRYELRQVLGSGGLATTYLAVDRLWSTQVALKLITGASERLRQILHREFSLLRAVFHPRLVQVHDFAVLAEPDPPSEGHARPNGEADSSTAATTCLYTADFVEGEQLGEYARGKSWDQVRRPFCDALRALRLLHAVGVRHGDFKPANILVDRQGRGVLIDLSCARPLDDLGEPGPRAEVSGSPGFIAPELLAGRPADVRSDLFAVGTTLDRLLAGLASPPPPAIPSAVTRLTRVRPQERPADVDEVLEALGSEPALIHPLVASLGRFVGREQELATATTSLAALPARSAAPRVLHVCGTEGMGRSRLLREIKWLAQQRYSVRESNPTAPDAVTRLLASAFGSTTAPLPTVASALRRWPEIVGPDAQPTVWFVDDADELGPDQRQLLTGIARLLEPTSPILLCVASDPELTLEAPVVHRIELDPLDAPRIDRWLGATVSASLRRHVHEQSGGVPGIVRALLSQLASSRLSEEELAATAGADLSRARLALIKDLSPAAQRALGWIALTPGTAQRVELERWRVTTDALDELTRSGLIHRQDDRFAMVRRAETASLLGALEPELIGELHCELARWLAERVTTDEADPATTARLAAEEVYHLALGGRLKRAAAGLLAGSAWYEAAPRQWAAASRAVAEQVPNREVQLVAAILQRQAGQTATALGQLTQLGEEDPGGPDHARILLELGSCQLELGDARSAVQHLAQAVDAAPDALSRARAAQLLARAHTKRGAYREALAHADRAAAESDDQPALRADALATAAVALSFLGDWTAARERLDEAAQLLSSIHDPRRQVRAHGNRALVAYNQGDLATAIEDYRRAFELAQQHGLSDQLATAALNFGTACHQAGRWADALRSYERGMRTAVALGQLGTETWLRFNIAKLYADLGQFDRAEVAADRCLEASQRSGLRMLAAAADTVRAEVAFARGDLARAEALFRRGAAGLDEHGSEREKAEVRIQQAEVDIAAGALDRAAERLEAAATLLPADARDVEVRLNLGRAALALAADHPSDAVPHAERAGAVAREIDQHHQAAEAELLLARAWARQDATTLARDHQGRAQRLWERTAAPLPRAARDAFWLHPKRAALALEPEPKGEPSARTDKLALLLDINQRLNSSLKTAQVLERAMDAAIELTGAERGFVLLVDDSKRRAAESAPVRVGVARNLDREELGRSHLKFSTGIAERVIASGEPVITADATSDDRFRGESSVHAMHLKSVVCVPVQAPSGPLGALYLDNRFERGRFTPDDVDLLLAFANQVAIALTNARLHDELRRRNRQLEAERRRVEQLLEGQAAEIDRLTEVVERRTITRPHRFDYSAIVGSSRGMQDLFALLDRVIDTALPILIYGESGTGKELVARAIHHNSPRRGGALVSINCAAVPATLLESELFGYERGAFTGADRRREGLVVQARDGTLFLDEIGEMPLSMQVKLLRVLQERQVQPLGAAAVVDVDFRLVCATNRRLRDEVAQGRFREDLYYRLSAVELELPPLRTRSDDIPALCAHLLGRIAAELGRPAPELGGHALRKLMSFDWPGNVRQLEHVLTKSVALAQTERIRPVDIDLPRDEPERDERLSRRAFQQSELERIAEALTANRWNIAKTARTLGIPRATLYRRIQQGGLKSPHRPSSR